MNKALFAVLVSGYGVFGLAAFVQLTVVAKALLGVLS